MRGVYLRDTTVLYMLITADLTANKADTVGAAAYRIC